MDALLLLNQLVSGITAAAVFFIIALGLTLVFGVVKVINNAHGSFYMFGLFLTYGLLSWVNNSTVGFLLAMFLVPVAIALMGGLIEFTAVRRVYREEHLIQFILTFAFIYIISDISKAIWGTIPLGAPKPDFLSGSLSLGDIILPTYNFFFILLAVAVGSGLWFILQRTKFGWQIRAATADPEMTAAIGVNVPLVMTLVFMIGAGLAGLAGAAHLGMTSASLSADLEMLVLSFIIVICAGVGSIGGTALVSLLLGITRAYGILVLPQFAIVFIYVVMVIILLIRPFGLFGRARL